MRKLIIVCNAQSSRYNLVQKEVFELARKLAGWMVGKYVITKGDLEENAAKLAKILTDGDLVVVAGGDGTAAMAVNGALASGKKVTLSALGYGNFNDLAHILKTRRGKQKGDHEEGGITEIVRAFEAGKVTPVWPLDVRVDGKHWRYATGYLTIGLFAESTAIFDEAKVRKKLQVRRRSPMFSWWNLVKWYFANRHQRDFIPEASLNGQKLDSRVTDYVAVNGTQMAGVMKGGDWYLAPEGFGSTVARLGSFWRLANFMGKSIISQVPLEPTKGDVLEFAQPSAVMAQAEGEYQKLTGVKKIEITKSKQQLEVVQL